MSANTDSLERDLEHDRDHLRETLDAIEQKMSPGRMLDDALAYFNTGPKDFATGLAGQVKDKPMPVLLTAVGLAWLILGDRKSASAEADADVRPTLAPDTGFAAEDYDDWMAHDRLQTAEWACMREDGETGDAYALRLQAARASALSLQADPEEEPQSFGTRVQGAADAVRQRGAGARDKLKQGLSGAKHGIGSALGGSRDAAAGAARKASDMGGAAVNSAKRLHETNPMATAAVGVAIGAVLGAAIPVSRREKAALAPMAEKSLAKGAEAGRAAADKIVDAIGADGSEKPTGTQPGMAM